MTQTRRAVWVGWWHAGKILLGLHFCRGYHRGVLTAGLARLTSYHQSLQACRQAWELSVTTLSIIYSCFLHNFHVQDDEKHFSTSNAHSYRFDLGIHGFTKHASSTLLTARIPVLVVNRGPSFRSARSALLKTDKATQSHMATNSSRCHKAKVKGDFPDGPVVKNLTANAWGHAFSPWSKKIPHASRQLSPCSATTEAPRARALQQEKPPQWEARTPYLESSPPGLLQSEEAHTQ